MVQTDVRWVNPTGIILILVRPSKNMVLMRYDSILMSGPIMRERIWISLKRASRNLSSVSSSHSGMRIPLRHLCQYWWLEITLCKGDRKNRTKGGDFDSENPQSSQKPQTAPFVRSLYQTQKRTSSIADYLSTSYLIRDVRASMDAYDTQKTGDLIMSFLDGLNNWYIRRNRRRFWRSELMQIKECLWDASWSPRDHDEAPSLHSVLYHREHLYQHLLNTTDSVHLTDFQKRIRNWSTWK